MNDDGLGYRAMEARENWGCEESKRSEGSGSWNRGDQTVPVFGGRLSSEGERANFLR